VRINAEAIDVGATVPPTPTAVLAEALTVAAARYCPNRHRANRCQDAGPRGASLACAHPARAAAAAAAGAVHSLTCAQDSLNYRGVGRNSQEVADGGVGGMVGTCRVAARGPVSLLHNITQTGAMHNADSTPRATRCVLLELVSEVRVELFCSMALVEPPHGIIIIP
jgi:hypothetical protein